MADPVNVPRTVAEIDWTRWKPVDVATLCFVIQSSEILLIRKLRGIGAGKINGPGGRLEPGESIEACAVREVEEEVGVTPHDLSPMGEQRFQFIDGYSIHVHVFIAAGCSGEVRTTDEAIPLWTAVDAIPYPEMWEDDILWLPRMLEGTPCSGRYIFDGDLMLDHILDDTFDVSSADC
jgi:8-oxo-dGTP diphosphatase